MPPYPSRAAKHVEAARGLQRPHDGVLQSDGYSAYGHYAKKTGITHAQCWSHARRKIFDARDIDPAQADQALDAIAALYKVEQRIREDDLTGQARVARRQEQSKPILERFFAWIDEQFDKQDFLATCRLQDINPYDDFVDVLQRVGQHPASLVNQLTPRIWKEMFADKQLRSQQLRLDLHELSRRCACAAA